VCDFGSAEIHDDNVVMMKHPGYDIYGHWILDTVPQLLMTKYMDLPASTTFVFDNVADWMRLLLEASEIEYFRTYQCRLSEHHNLAMPSGLNNGYALAQPINTVAWNNLRLHFNHLGVKAGPSSHERLYVSRRNWGGQRGIANEDDVEQVMKEAGFTVFHPQQHSLAEQAAILENARVVVGEDGSALHSLVFTRPGARLGILMHADRMNLWHAGICDAMGHRLGYWALGQEGSQAYADIGGLRDFVSQLLAA